MTASMSPLRAPPLATEPITNLLAALSTTARSSWNQFQAPLSLNSTMLFGSIGVAGNAGQELGPLPEAPLLALLPPLLAPPLPALGPVSFPPRAPAAAALIPPALAPPSCVLPGCVPPKPEPAPPWVAAAPAAGLL